MRRLRRPDPLAAAAVVLFVVAVATSLAGAGGTAPALGGRTASVYDDGPGGATVLRRYLADAGLRVDTIEGARFGPIASDVVLVLGATEEIDAAAAGLFREHMDRGGTVVVATDVGFSERRLLEPFGVRVAAAAEPGDRAVRGAIFASPPVRRISVGRGVRLDLPSGADALTAGAPVAASITVGRGSLVVVGSLDPFINATVGDADNGRFALALARLGRSVAFDEHHHGVRPDPNAFAVLFGTWPGAALIAAGLSTFAYLVLSGRRLGPALPLDPRPPRSSLEYVRAFAGLVRRSGRGEIARRRLRDDLRRGVARIVGADPEAPLDRLATGLDRARAAEARELDALLGRPLRDADLLRTVRRIDALISEARDGLGPSQPQGPSRAEQAKPAQRAGIE
ncbi:MAG TPA: DUF4350 domain-containing protein [Candidatus Limnocylindria bacterium]|nr:DUF4350 domain-containing protein [Candidatus Limnocylindria bacterium]